MTTMTRDHTTYDALMNKPSYANTQAEKSFLLSCMQEIKTRYLLA